MVKRTYVDGNGLRKGAWTSEEDDKLRAYVERYGHWNWRLLPHFAGLDRCGKSCRLRWMNYLKPGVRRGGYTQQETDLIAALHRQHGNKWSIIASKLPGRTDNEVKNYWHAHLKNRLDTLSAKAEISSSHSITSAAPKLCRRKHGKTRVSSSSSSSDVFVLESSEESNSAVVLSVAELGSDSSTEQIFSDLSSMATRNDDNLSDLLDSGFDDDFWTQPFMVETNSYHSCDFRVDEEVGIFSPFLGTWLNDVNNMF